MFQGVAWGDDVVSGSYPDAEAAPGQTAPSILPSVGAGNRGEDLEAL